MKTLEVTYFKRATTLLNKSYVNKRTLELLRDTLHHYNLRKMCMRGKSWKSKNFCVQGYLFVFWQWEKWCQVVISMDLEILHLVVLQPLELCWWWKLLSTYALLNSIVVDLWYIISTQITHTQFVVLTEGAVFIAVYEAYERGFTSQNNNLLTFSRFLYSWILIPNCSNVIWYLLVYHTLGRQGNLFLIY